MPSNFIGTPSVDPGDDVQRRFRYQNAYGIILLLGLIELGKPGLAVYFEHHEDLLIELGDGTFIAVQVKTKDAATPAKATDSPIVSSIKRFIHLESTHPGVIHSFRLVSSTGFYQDRSSSDLAEVLRTVKQIGSTSLTTNKVTKQLCKKLIPPADVDLAHAVLCKTDAVEDAPGLNDVESRLLALLQSLDLCQLALTYQMRFAVRNLIAVGARAAVYRPEGPNYDAIAVLNGTAAIADTIIAQKRVPIETVLAIIKESLDAPAPSDMGFLSLIERDNVTLRKKMVLAKVPATKIEFTASCADHARAQLQAQKQRVGRVEARARDNKLRAVVHGAFDTLLQSAPTRSGAPLYEHILNGIARLPASRQDLPAADQEELLGIAAMLSDECKLWWAENRSFPVESS